MTRKFLASEPGWRRGLTCTTRAPRPDEKDGEDYKFLSKDEFVRMASRGAFVEFAFVYGNGYGTPRDEILSAWADGKNVILVLDTQGKKAVKTLFPDAITVFLKPPSMEELERRIRGRGTESEEAVRRRLDEAEAEMKKAGEYDHVLINADAAETARRLSEMAKGF